MTETQRKIKEYQDALPGLRERVMAVALLLVVSLTMVVSTSFAWITLSQAPEITNVNTTVAANGNLEIALVSVSGVEPGVSQIGDSSAAEGQSVTEANITWGNLVNLSDSSYGLSNIVLRPALLSNASNLLTQPLKGADYGSDGRMEIYYNEDFQFTNWVEPSNGLDGYFKYYDTPQYGVRAISTVEYTYKNNTYFQFTQLMKVATGYQEATKSTYASSKLVGNEEYINALAGLIGDFMTDKLNDKNGATDVSGYIEDVYNMMCAFEEIVYDFGDAMVALANVQVYNKYGPDTYATYTYTRDSFFSETDANLAANGVDISCLNSYRTIQSKLQTILYGTDPDTDDCIKDFYDRITNDRSAKVTIGELLPYINQLVDINSCKIILPDGTTYTVGGIGMSAATQLLGKKVDAQITKGVLKDFEQLSGCKMFATNVEVKATYIMTVTMTAKSITTAASDPYLYDTDVATTTQTAAENKGEFTAVAQDTYGMAIDMWVRTNADNSYLTLEGNVLTRTDTVRDTGIDRNGNIVELYTATVSTLYSNDDGTTETISEDVAVYKIITDGTETWYYASDHSLLYNYDENGELPEGQTISTPIERFKDVVTVIGYEGENRVWDENIFLDSSSTTQGSGSCYVFYADDPGQQEYCLRLLKNLRVAFIDSNEASETYGKMVALGKLDIDSAYEENGKVTLPLVLTDDGSTYLTKTEDGLAIMLLDKNVATRLTAIVYLDGREISNADVLAANDIHGQLNIQFGSSVSLEAVSDEKLELATRSVTAVAAKATANQTPDQGTYPGSNSQISFSYDTDTDFTVFVKLAVQGELPNKVTAFFMRKVNETQGSREGTFTLTKAEDGYYYGQYTFTSPGQYVLRTVQLDGVDYSLPASDYPSVLIEGFSINNVTMMYGSKLIDTGSYTIMTGDKTVSTDLSLSFSSNQTRLPGSVRLQFLRTDGTQVTTTLTYDATTAKWNGTANFTSSGVYTLKYVIMDGEYSELSPAMQRELTLYMGMSVRIQDGGEKLRDMVFEGQSFTIPVYVDIYDNTGARIQYLNDVKLIYTRAGSKVDGMSPSLKWNSSEGCYTGNLQIAEPGIFNFDSVTVGTSVIKSTTNVPPVYTCISPEPPSYWDAEPMEGMDYELSTGSNTLNVGIRLANASSATVTATLTSGGNTYQVVGTTGTTVNEYNANGEKVPVTTFTFTLPVTATVGDSNYQSGNWTITSLSMVNVFTIDENDVLTKHEADNPLIMEVPATTALDEPNDVHVQVVNVKLELKGTDENLNGGNFMGTAAAQNAITVVISDQNGDPLNSQYININDLKITYKYVPQSSKTYGGYMAENEAVADIELTPSGNDGKTFTMENISLGYAGKYEANTLTFTVAETAAGGDSRSLTYASQEYADRVNTKDGTLDIPVYTLSTAKPTVTISTVSTNPTTARYYTTAKPSSTNGMITGSYNWKANDGYSAVVYMYFAAKSGTLDQECVAIKYPTVTLSLSGIPTTHGGTTMVFPGTNGNSSTFTFAAGGTTATSTIGAGTNGVYDEGILGLGAGVDTWPVLYPAGKQTVSQISVTYGGVVYTVDLSHSVTINNPLCPPYADFVINDSTFTGTVPSRVYSTDGETITVTLPTIASWSYDVTENSDGDYAATGNVTTSSVYTTSGNWLSKYTYTKYTQTSTEYQAVSSSTTYTVTKTITGWKIGNTVYKPGDTVTLTGSQTITAVISAQNGASTTVTTTATKYYVTFAATGETTTTRSSAPSSYGTGVSSVTAYWTDPTYS